MGALGSDDDGLMHRCCFDGELPSRLPPQFAIKGWSQSNDAIIYTSDEVPWNSHVTGCLCCLLMLFEKLRGTRVSDK